MSSEPGHEARRLAAHAPLRSRRRALLGLLLLVPGCGFRPLHGLRPEGSAAPALSAVRVGLIPERNGQLLRRELEARLGSRNGAAARYDLRVGLAYGVEAQGFARDGTPSRVRITATANWFLYDLNVLPRLLANGAERAFDAYNIPENQFFAADTARDATERRLVEQLAEDIARRLAIRLEAAATAAR